MRNKESSNSSVAVAVAIVIHQKEQETASYKFVKENNEEGLGKLTILIEVSRNTAQDQAIHNLIGRD